MADDTDVLTDEVRHDRDLHREAAKAAFPVPPDVLTSAGRSDLAGALYTFSELSLWPDDIDSISVEQALQVWAVVEGVRARGFPGNLRM